MRHGSIYRFTGIGFVQFARARRGFSIGGAIFLLLIILACIGLYYLSNKEHHDADVAFHEDLTDPKNALEYFIVERNINHEFASKDWKKMLAFQSADDLQWFEANKLRLAGMNMRTPGIAATLGTPDEQEYAALETLLRFKLNPDRPFVSTVETHGDYTIAYIQMPNNAATLQPIFLHKEQDQWKILRFMGERDQLRIIGEFARQKSSDQTPLDADEQLYMQKKDDYPAAKTDQLYALVGLPPVTPAAAGNAGPAPAPIPAATPPPSAPAANGAPTPIPTPTPL